MILTAAQLFITMLAGIFVGGCITAAHYDSDRKRIDGGHTKGRPRQSIPPRVGRR